MHKVVKLISVKHKKGNATLHQIEKMMKEEADKIFKFVQELNQKDQQNVSKSRLKGISHESKEQGNNRNNKRDRSPDKNPFGRVDPAFFGENQDLSEEPLAVFKRLMATLDGKEEKSEASSKPENPFTKGRSIQISIQF